MKHREQHIVDDQPRKAGGSLPYTDWPHLVLCLDGMAPLLKRSPDNITLLKAILTRSGLQMIGVMSTWEYQDLLAGDAQLQDMLTRIEISEPTEEETLEIVKSHRSALEQQYAVNLEPDRERRVVAGWHRLAAACRCEGVASGGRLSWVDRRTDGDRVHWKFHSGRVVRKSRFHQGTERD